MRDGRVFQGTGLDIVRAMQDMAFGAGDFTVPDYIEWVVDNAYHFEASELEVTGASDDERADSLIREMLRVGLASRA